MAALREATEEFLAGKRIAVAGVSRSSGQAANLVYRRLRDRGYTVFAVNPNAETVEGDRCYSDLRSIPDGSMGSWWRPLLLSRRAWLPSAPSSGSGGCGCIALLGRAASRKRRSTTAASTASR